MRNRLYNKYHRFWLRLTLLLTCTFPLLGCWSKFISIEQIENIKDFKINRLAIVPLTANRTYPEDSSRSLAEDTAILTRLLKTELDRFYYIITREKVKAALSMMPSLKPQQIATILGKELAVDAVLMGRVTRYQLRKGAAYAASQPASVAFELYLLESKKGTIIWSARFDKTQKFLSEDLSNISSFIQGEWRWLTAEELMKLGLNQTLDKFPGMRERKEQKKLRPLRSTLPSDLG